MIEICNIILMMMMMMMMIEPLHSSKYFINIVAYAGLRNFASISIASFDSDDNTLTSSIP